MTAILEAHNTCRLQPDPGFADDNNYLKNTVAEEAHLDFFGELPEEKVVLADGTDVTEVSVKAIGGFTSRPKRAKIAPNSIESTVWS